jgi:hypothetical protein
MHSNSIFGRTKPNSYVFAGAKILARGESPSRRSGTASAELVVLQDPLAKGVNPALRDLRDLLARLARGVSKGPLDHPDPLVLLALRREG